MTDRSRSRLESGATWSDFLARLKNAGDVIERTCPEGDLLTKAEGYRYVARIARAALETFVENADPRAPVLQRVVHETAKMGADNPDNFYQNAAIDGRERYVLRGTRGTVHFLRFYTQIGDYGKGAGMPPSGRLDASELVLDDEGRFEIHVATERPEGAANWLPMKEDTGTLIIRQTFMDREKEVLADVTIERVGAEGGAPTPPSPELIESGITQAGNLVAGAVMLFANWVDGFEKHTNTLPLFDPELSTSFGGDPAIDYYHSYWALEPGQALVIDAMPPECEHWNFQLNNHWMESLDYRYYRIHVNKASAVYRDDGGVRVVVAHEDPGVPNWIDTVDHHRGTMCWRWFFAKGDAPQPSCRVVPVADVAALPFAP